MRVIAGTHKGRPLKTTAKADIRPTSDKIKEALFQQIGPFFHGGYCLDLYAGSGALGIEALSRGIEKSVFVDKNPQAIKVIRKNVARLTLENHSYIYRSDAKRILQSLHKKGWQFQCIFLDPPYEQADFSETIHLILQQRLLAEDGIICCEHALSQHLPDFSDALTIIKQKAYGSTTGTTIYTQKVKEG